MISNDAHVNLRMPAELLEAVDAAAAERHATRSALIRGALEDAIDAGELPTPAKMTDELIAELRLVEDERLRELTRH